MQQNVGNAKRMHMYANALDVCAPYAAVAQSSTVPPHGEREIISTKITGSEPTILYLITMHIAYTPPSRKIIHVALVSVNVSQHTKF